MNDALPHWLRNVLLITLLASGSLAIYYAISLYRLNTQTLITAHESANKKVQQTAQFIDHFISILKTEIQNIGSVLEATQFEKNALEKIMQQKPVEITGIGIINNAGNNPTGYYYVEKDDRQQFIPLDAQQISDFGIQENIFKGAIVDPITQEEVIIYAQLFNKTIVFATQSLAHIDHVLATLYIGKSGYLVLTDSNDTILLHPQHEMIGSTMTHDQKGSWVIAQSVPSIGWKVYGVFDIQETTYDEHKYRHYWILIILCAFITLLLASCIFIGNYWWLLVIIISLLYTSTIGFIWTVVHRYPHYKKVDSIPIKNKITLYEFLDQQQTKQEQVKKELTLEKLKYYLTYRYKAGGYVPTGIYFQDIALTSPETMDIDGFVWQRYFEGIHDGISRGFIFPQAAQEPKVHEIFRSKEDKTETIVWQFNVEINQELSYSHYPFDVKQISVELAHTDFNKNVLLVPDLDAYSLLNPAELPGINPNLYIAEWYIKRTGFEYHLENYRTNFGLYAYGPFGIYKTKEQTTTPVLAFSARLERGLLQTLIIDLLPLIVIGLLLFICFITDKRQEFSGFVPSLAGIFFATIISHLSFRGKIPPHEFAYLETFYLIIYGMLVMVTIFSMLDMFEIPISWIQKNNNRIAKSLYWPVLLSLILIVTVWYLY